MCRACGHATIGVGDDCRDNNDALWDAMHDKVNHHDCRHLMETFSDFCDTGMGRQACAKSCGQCQGN